MTQTPPPTVREPARPVELPPPDSPGYVPGPAARVTFLGTCAAVWLLLLLHLPLALPIAAVLAAAFLARGPAAGAERAAAAGLTAVVLLLLKDLCPGQPPGFGRWLSDSGLGAAQPWLGTRNPQVLCALRQAGAVAACFLGAAAVHAAWVRRYFSRGQWLSFLTALLAAWCLAVFLGLRTHPVYGAEHHVLAVPSKNSAASLAALGSILGLGYCWASARRDQLARAGAGLAAAALCLATLAELRSWTGVIGAAAGLGLMGWRAMRRRASAGHSAIAAAAAAAALGAGLLVLNPDLGDRLRSPDGDYRISIWRDCLPLVQASPVLGTGLGSFEGVYPLSARLELTRDSRMAHPDSSWVLLAIEWGLLPSALVLGAAAWTVLGGRHHRGAASEDQDPAVRATVRSAVLAWLVCAITDPAFHRPETLGMGCALLAVVRGSHGGVRTRPGLRVAAVLGLAALAGAGAWARIRPDGFAEPSLYRERDLALDPLNPRVHLNAAAAILNRALQLAHLRASVLLDHRSARLPWEIARRLTAAQPAEAAYYWEKALERARADPGYASTILEGGLNEFPGQPLGYWEPIVFSADPDLGVVLAARAGPDAPGILRRWVGLAKPSCLSVRDLSQDFFAGLGAAPGQAGLLEDFLKQNPRGLPRNFLLRAVRLLHASGRDEPAWNVLLSLEPFLGADRERNGALPQREYYRAQALVRSIHDENRARLLKELCGQPSAPVWFHLEYARELRRLGREAEAVEHLMGLAAP